MCWHRHTRGWHSPGRQRSLLQGRPHCFRWCQSASRACCTIYEDRFCLAARTSQSPKVARWLTCTLLKFAAKIDPWPIPCPPTLRVPPSRTPCTFLASHLRSYSCDSGHFHDVSVRIRAIMRSLGRSFPFRVRSLMYAILFKFFDWPSGSCIAVFWPTCASSFTLFDRVLFCAQR